VAIAKDHVLSNNYEADRLIGGLTLRLGRPVALMGEHQGRLYGRKDIVRWLQSQHPSQLPWRQVHLNG
jgi:hypothetical protein